MITIYTKEDLIKEAKDKSIEDIKFYDFKVSKEPVLQAELVVYFESHINFKVIKNRYMNYDNKAKELFSLIGIRVIDENI